MSLRRIIIDNFMVRQSARDEDIIILSDVKAKKAFSIPKDYAFRMAISLLSFGEPTSYETEHIDDVTIMVITGKKPEDGGLKIKPGQQDIAQWMVLD